MVEIGSEVRSLAVSRTTFDGDKEEKERLQKELASTSSKISNSEIEQIEFEIKESSHKKSIENLINTNPEIVTQLLKTWLDEE